MLKLLAFYVVAVGCFGQGPAVNQVAGPTPNNFVYYYDIASTPQYVCQAQSMQQLTTFQKSTGTITQIVVATNVGTITFGSTSYLWVGAQVTVSGSTTSALNGTYKITAVSGSTATITTSGVSDGTYNNAAMALYTNAPLLNSLVWAIQITQYSGGSPIGQYWAGLPSPTPPMNLACSNRANY